MKQQLCEAVSNNMGNVLSTSGPPCLELGSSQILETRQIDIYSLFVSILHDAQVASPRTGGHPARSKILRLQLPVPNLQKQASDSGTSSVGRLTRGVRGSVPVHWLVQCGTGSNRLQISPTDRASHSIIGLAIPSRRIPGLPVRRLHWTKTSLCHIPAD